MMKNWWIILLNIYFFNNAFSKEIAFSAAIQIDSVPQNQQSIDLIITDTSYLPHNFTTQVHRQINDVYVNVWVEKKDSSVEFMPKEIKIGDGFSRPMEPGYFKGTRNGYFVRVIQGKQMVHMGTLILPTWELRKYKLKEYCFHMTVQYIKTKNSEIAAFYTTVRVLLK